MSIGSLVCPKCQSECQFAGVYPFPPGQQETYAVGWTCPACGNRSMDVCNVGPLVPTATSCLNCPVGPVSGDDPCPGCGLGAAESRGFLRVPETPAEDALRQAHEAFQRGWFRHGIALANQILQSDVSATAAWDLKYHLLTSLGFLGAAEQMVRGALAAGAPPILLIRLGSLLSARGAQAEAAEAYHSCLDSGLTDPPTVAIVCSQLGLCLTALGRMEEAEHVHRRACATWPDHALLYLNHADLYIRQRRLDEALPLIDAGLHRARTDSDAIDLLDARGHVLAGLMRGEEALACVDEAIRRGSDSVRTHYIRGRSLAMIGRLAEARAAMQRVLQLEPNRPDAQQALAQIEAALRGE